MRLLTACVAVAMALTIAQGADPDSIIPEALVEELADVPQEADAVQITRECFERTCSTSGCRIARMECDLETSTPWAVFVSPQTKQNKLVQMPKKKRKQADGLVDIVVHKKPLDPNMAIAMPGVPATASPHMVKQMKRQDKLMKKIVKMEKWEYSKDPLHKATRKKWLDLAATIKHLPPGPARMKEQVLLLKLAKELADKEKHEQAAAKKISVDQAKAASSPASKVDPEEAKKLMKAILRKADAPSDAKPQKTIDGIPVGHRQCFERACISRTADGECGAAVISCGAGGKKPQHVGHLSKKAAIKLAKKSMGHLLPFAQAAGQN